MQRRLRSRFGLRQREPRRNHVTRVPGSSQPEMGHGRLVRAVRLQRWMATGSEPGQVYVTTHGGRQDAGEAVDEDEGCIQQQVDQHNNIAEDHPSETGNNASNQIETLISTQTNSTTSTGTGHWLRVSSGTPATTRAIDTQLSKKH